MPLVLSKCLSYTYLIDFDGFRMKSTLWFTIALCLFMHVSGDLAGYVSIYLLLFLMLLLKEKYNVYAM